MSESAGPRRRRIHWRKRPTRGYHCPPFSAVTSCSSQISCSPAVTLAWDVCGEKTRVSDIIAILIVTLLPVHEVRRRTMHWAVRSHWPVWRRTKARAWWAKVVRSRVSGAHELVRPVRSRRSTVRSGGATGTVGAGPEGEGRPRGSRAAWRRLTAVMTRRTTVGGRGGHAGAAGTESIELWRSGTKLRSAHGTRA